MKRISDRVWLTPTGIVDLDAKRELTPAQKFHNDKLDFEIKMAQKEFEHRLAQDKLMGRITVIGPKRIFGIRYVE